MDRIVTRYISIATIIIILFVSSSNPVYSKNDSDITLQLRWNPQFQFAGYYMAKWLGYYKDEGLNVDIKDGFTEDGEILSATKEVSEGRADFGIGASNILLAQDEGADLAVVASIFQRSPVEFYMLEETPYKTVIDFTRLNTARRKNDLLDIELQAMLTNEGIKYENSNLLKENVDFTIKDLTSGKYDIVPEYLGTISFNAKKNGIKLKKVKPIDYGIDFYGDSLFTTEEFASIRPEIVEKFRKASMKGWEYALEHPEETALKITEKFGSNRELYNELVDYNKFQATKVMEATLYPVVELGNVNPHRWNKMNKILINLGFVDENINMDKFIFDYEKIVNTKKRKLVNNIIIFLTICLILSIIIFILYLTSKNNRLKEEMAENKRKEAIIIYQARLAAMGEMIANIAHQWRQPLNSLGLILSNIEDAYRYNDLDDKYLNKTIGKSRRLIENMSQTIDDFRYFLSPKNQKESFIVYEKISAVLDLIEEKLKIKDINVKFEKIEMTEGYGYPNQFSQAIFNVINNSIDALVSNNIKKKSIRIYIYEEENMVAIKINDNGGGIDNSIKDKIFDMYFTTKDKTKGTGLGLYMTKMIIENNMDGELSAQNIKDGLSMKIEIPRGNE
ncbi:ABC transporter substrate-binding protein [Dethiothermospora halolimnae]|uniref:ABC transporter substrate-binding protein n=1 Tax=Dethiothermospora halolimnae TaxID=3114390 RepID=UPI003CCC416C